MVVSGHTERVCCPAMASFYMHLVRRRPLNTGERDMFEKGYDDNYDDTTDHLTQPQQVCKSMMTRPIKIFTILQSLSRMQSRN